MNKEHQKTCPKGKFFVFCGDGRGRTAVQKVYLQTSTYLALLNFI